MSFGGGGDASSGVAAHGHTSLPGDGGDAPIGLSMVIN